MRLPVESYAGRARGLVLALMLVPALAGCGSHRQLASASAEPAKVNGPAADYPIVIGAPYRIGDKLYTPVDTMNYDEVGYLAAGPGAGITAAHHTLPLPSYAEVTSLKTGHTILVRVERRGPMNGNQLIALSPAALTQLGGEAGDPVRVRRVNPPELERAALRAGRGAPARMDTPASLVAVLKQKLPPEGAANLVREKSDAPAALATAQAPPSSAIPISAPASIADAPPRVRRAASRASPLPLPPLPGAQSWPASSRPSAVVVARLEQPTPPPAKEQASAEPRAPAAKRQSAQAAESAPAAREGTFVVQAAAMSTMERARKVAGSIGGSVSKAGRYFRVRTGPFASREQAEASLAKVRAAGYSDARISTDG